MSKVPPNLAKLFFKKSFSICNSPILEYSLSTSTSFSDFDNGKINRANINGEKTVSAHKICCRKCNKHQRYNQYRIKALNVKLDYIDGVLAEKTKSKPCDAAH